MDHRTSPETIRRIRGDPLTLSRPVKPAPGVLFASRYDRLSYATSRLHISAAHKFMQPFCCVLTIVLRIEVLAGAAVSDRRNRRRVAQGPLPGPASRPGALGWGPPARLWSSRKAARLESEPCATYP